MNLSVAYAHSMGDKEKTRELVEIYPHILKDKGGLRDLAKTSIK